MIQQILQGLNPDLISLLMLALLVAAFVVAFKVLGMIIETGIVSVLSAVMYVALSYLFNFDMQLSNIILFAFLGAALYMSYSFLASAYSIVEKLLKIPYLALKIVLKPFKMGYAHLRKKRKMKKLQKKTEENAEEDARNVKKVVLDKVRDEDN